MELKRAKLGSSWPCKMPVGNTGPPPLAGWNIALGSHLFLLPNVKRDGVKKKDLIKL